jgi:membrane associated rhomboid family serine protease
MIPIRDHNPSGRVPIVTYFLILLNLGIFFYMISLPFNELQRFVQEYAVIPADIAAGRNLSTLFTSMFLHGSFGHIFGNMLFLYIFGDNLEETYGRRRYILFYLFSGLAASGLQIAVNPQLTIPTLGASGAIAGVLGGYLILFPKHRIDVILPPIFLFSIPAYLMLFYWIGFQFLLGFGTLGAEGGGVAYFAHIGGFVMGVLLSIGLILRKRRTRAVDQP